MLAKARELAGRKNTILKTIAEQGQLTDTLRLQIEQCSDSRILEDLYLPYRPKKRTRAAIARERGLQPLADILLGQQLTRESRKDLIKSFVNPAKMSPMKTRRLGEPVTSWQRPGPRHRAIGNG
jgi:uncharacterized protein